MGVLPSLGASVRARAQSQKFEPQHKTVRPLKYEMHLQFNSTSWLTLAQVEAGVNKLTDVA